MMILTMGSLATIYGFWTHTEYINKLGVLEYIFVTPSHHRVHHGKYDEYIGIVMIDVFIILAVVNTMVGWRDKNIF